MTSKIQVFSKLVAEVHACKKCERMCASARVLGFSAGALDAKVMFIGEAPGRLGADQTQIPFHGDAAGGNFEDFLLHAGIHRSDIYVTNAVLCNPKDAKGNNATPIQSEVDACRDHLKRQIELIDPKIVVSLGAVALRALSLIEPHGLSLSSSVRSANQWFGRELVPLYHPGQRALIHRSRANQRSDYQFVAERMRRVGKVRRVGTGVTPNDLLATCRYLISRRQRISYFELHKLAYLMEYLHVKKTGRRLSDAHFLRQKDGPYCIELQIDKIRRADPSIGLKKVSGRLLLEGIDGGLLDRQEDPLPKHLIALADEVLLRYSYTSEADLKRAVYLTAPMRLILRREKDERLNLYNTAIEFLSA